MVYMEVQEVNDAMRVKVKYAAEHGVFAEFVQ
jgi:hypothetical protein